MSKTAGVIITEAYREINLVAIGHEPQPEEVSEALPRLDALVGSLYGFELGGPLRSWIVPETWEAEEDERHPLTPDYLYQSTQPWRYPPANVRIILGITKARTLFFPAVPPDGARIELAVSGATANPTLHANGLTIETLAYLTDTPGNLHGRRWIFRADLGGWVRVNPVTSTDVLMPLPEEFDDLFVTGLAIRLAARFGVQVTQELAQRYSDMLGRAVLRYTEQEPRSPAELRTIIRTTP